jgi:hypothetical protein
LPCVARPQVMKISAALLCCILVATSGTSASAQTFDALPLGRPRTIADYASTIAVAQTLATDAGLAIKRGHDQGKTWQAAACVGAKDAAFNLSAIGLKKLFPSARPDGSGNDGAFSEHTGNAVIAIGYNYWVSIPIAASIAVARGLADKHTFWQRIQGGALGGLELWGFSKIPACKGLQ